MKYVLIAEMITWFIVGVVVLGIIALILIAGILYFAKSYKIDVEETLEDEYKKWLDQ